MTQVEPLLEAKPGAAAPAVGGVWWRRGTISPIGVAGAVIIALNVLAALVGSLLWRVDPNSQAATRLLSPSLGHPLGTDELGRDTLARLLHGAQVSLQVGLVAVLIALVAGTVLGLAAAYYRGAVDAILMRIVDILFAVPWLVLAIMIAGLLGPSRTNAMIAVGIIYTPAFARVVRGSSLSILALPFVEASRALGSSGGHIVLRHLLPNIVAPLIVLSSVYFGGAVLAAATLSFLGLGIQPPEADWGSMLNGARSYMVLAPWLAIFPGLAIVFVVFGFNLLGDGLRDWLDPKGR
ncbi:MAG: ABC transporter permease [Candidatus Dormiibacterota bacterium]